MATADHPKRKTFVAIFAAVVSATLINTSVSFSILSTFPATTVARSASASSRLFAVKKSKKKKAPGRNTSGFGGAAVEPCPCGSGDGYAKCCGKLHLDANAYKQASAEQVVRARYSAYAKRQIDFIIASTHPLNKNFETDMKHWKDTIRNNCYDNFELTKCKIIEFDTETDDQNATVKFVAELVQRDSREKSGFMETATFERAKTHGGWLYRDGVIEAAPSGDSNGDAADVTVVDIEAKMGERNKAEQS